MTNAEHHVAMLIALSDLPDALLVDETRDAQWADFGRLVHSRLVSPDMPEVLTRAGLKSKSTIEMVGYIRAFILTGAKP